MLQAKKISELPLHPDSSAGYLVELHHIVPVVGYDSGGALTTYKAPVSGVAPAVEFNGSATTIPANSTPTAVVTRHTDPQERNVFDLELGIPAGTTPVLLDSSVVTIADDQPQTVSVSQPNPGEFQMQFNLRRGPQGLQGDPGVGITFKGERATKAELDAWPNPQPGDAFFVNSDETFTPAKSGVFYKYGLDESDNLTWLSGGALIGPQGPEGPPGFAASFNDPQTTTLPPGEDATVTKDVDPIDNSVTLTFGIPQGITPDITATATTVEPTVAASVTRSGPSENPTLEFSIPRGITPDITATATTVEPTVAASVTRSGTPENPTFEFSIPQGEPGNWATPQEIINEAANFTASSAHKGKIVTVSGAAVITVDASTGLAEGEKIDFIRTGTGAVSFARNGVQLNGTPSLVLRDQWSSASLICLGTDNYVVIGDLA
jgi:hypothetical protein